MPTRWRFALCVLLSCLGMGALPALVEAVFRGMALRGFLESSFEGFIYALCISVPTWVALPRLFFRLRERSFFLLMLATAAVLTLFAVAGCFLANLLLLAAGLVPRAAFIPQFSWSLKISLCITFTFGVLGTVLATLQRRLASVREELHLRQVAEERDRKMVAEARFASLESRVHPHFLFNTLNSISALVREDPAEAERMIERLAALLRFSLDSELAGVVPLREELKIVRDYLEIEKVRFGSRLRYRIDSTEPAGAQMVPALSVQTLVENSVKYAVGALREGAEIVVSARVHDGTLRVEVSDDGPGFEPAQSLKPGHGLDLLDRRLTSLFGAGAALEMSMTHGRMLVAISLAA